VNVCYYITAAAEFFNLEETKPLFEIRAAVAMLINFVTHYWRWFL